MSKYPRLNVSTIILPIYSDNYFEFLGGTFLKKNQKKYKGITIAKHYKGKTIKNEFGECYKISARTKIIAIEPNHKAIEQRLLLDLKVIAGISNATEASLKREGIQSITDLTKHYRYGYNAAKYLRIVEQKNAIKIYEHLSLRLTSSNPLLLANSALFNLSEIVFIDIETLGLSDCPLFLIGIASFKDNYLMIDQIFVRELKEEKAALHFLGTHIQDKQAIGTFNGKSFDVPFIRKRMERHDLKHVINLPHFDIKYFSQRAFIDTVPNFRLSTLEAKLFQVKRVEDVPGEQIPYYYRAYIKSKNIGSVVPIIDHNKQDLISTAKLFMKLHDIWN